MTEPTHDPTLEQLLAYGRVLTIYKRDKGFAISFADVESEDNVLYYVPDQIMLVHEDCTITQALTQFNELQQMIYVQGMHA